MAVAWHGWDLKTSALVQDVGSGCETVGNSWLMGGGWWEPVDVGDAADAFFFSGCMQIPNLPPALRSSGALQEEHSARRVQGASGLSMEPSKDVRRMPGVVGAAMKFGSPANCQLTQSRLKWTVEMVSQWSVVAGKHYIIG